MTYNIRGILLPGNSIDLNICFQLKVCFLSESSRFTTYCQRNVAVFLCLVSNLFTILILRLLFLYFFCNQDSKSYSYNSAVGWILTEQHKQRFHKLDRCYLWLELSDTCFTNGSILLQFSFFDLLKILMTMPQVFSVASV